MKNLAAASMGLLLLPPSGVTPLSIFPSSSTIIDRGNLISARLGAFPGHRHPLHMSLRAPYETTSSSLTPTRTSSPPSPTTTSPLRMICDERREFEMNVGRAADVLKKDYPEILHKSLDFSIYHENLEVIDPSGFKLHGLNNYRNFFRVLRTIVSLFYCPEDSGLTFRLVYDWARSSLRVSWRAVLIPRSIYGGVKNTLHVDGISVYGIDNEGKIIQHKVERLLINERPVEAPKGIFQAVHNEAQGIPVLGMNGGTGSAILPGSSNTFSNSLRSNQLSPRGRNGRTSTALQMTSTSSSSSDINFNAEEFERRNTYRKKFGVPPLTPEEFLEVEAQVRILEEETQQRRATLAQDAAELAAQQENERRLKRRNPFSSVLKDTCESNYDCERPEVCCDFIFAKRCCASGMGVYNHVPGQKIPARVPVTRNDGYPGPDTRPGSI